MTERFEWIEKAGIENMKLHHVSADNLAKDSATTLTVLLAGMGGSFTYAVKVFDTGCWNWLTAGAATLTFWFALLGFYLVIKCLMATPIPQIYNEPANLNVTGLDFEDIRQAELDNLQARINEAARRNRLTAKQLNVVRRLAVSSPFIFIGSALVFRWWG